MSQMLKAQEDTILFIGSFAEPEPNNGNRTLAMQALALQRLGYRVEILTWPFNDTWRGARPDKSECIAGVPYLHESRYNLHFHVVDCPRIWSERVLTEAEWESAVQWGMHFLGKLRPKLVHQQFWQHTWWMLEAARRLGIPMIYSAHDYGIACLRTVLVTGKDALCDGRVAIQKCAVCIVGGRNLLGKLNEWTAKLPLANIVLNAAFGKQADGPIARAGGVRMSVEKRVGLTVERCERIFSELDGLVVASPFAGEFFSQFGGQPDKMHVIPWFYAQEIENRILPDTRGVLRLGMAARMSPDKGVHIFLEALQQVTSSRAIEVKIAGNMNNSYASGLKERFSHSAGGHKITWCGWVSNDHLDEFYEDVHVAIVPSLWYDNCPLSLVEALAYGRPVICTDVPSMTHLVKHEVNGLVFPMGDAAALARRIEYLAENISLIEEYARCIVSGPSLHEYAIKIGTVYDQIFNEKQKTSGGFSLEAQH